MGDEITDTSFGVQVGVGFFGILLTQLAGFIGSVILARAIGPSGYGLFYLSLSIANFFENPIKGWTGACRKRLAETDFKAGEALGSALIVLLIMVSIIGPLSFIVLRTLSENKVVPVAVPLLFVPTSTYLSIRQLLSSRENFALVEWSSVFRTVLKVSFQLGLVTLGFGVWGMIGGLIIATLLTIPIVYYWLNISPQLPSTKALKSIANYAKWSIPGRFLGTGLSRIDIILLGWLSAASVAGKYQVALKLAMPAALISGAISRGLLGRISNLESRGQDWRKDFRNALSMESILAVPVFFGSLVMAERIIVTVFSSQYTNAGGFLIGLSLYKVLDTQTSPRESVLGAIDRPDIGFYTSLVALILNVALGIGLWYVYGAVGIVVATVITQGFIYVSRSVAVWWLTKADAIITRPFIEQVIAGASMAAILTLVEVIIQLDEWITVLIMIGFGAMCYFVVLTVISSYCRSTVYNVYLDFQDEYDPF